jgi:hypothetical protein
MSNPDIRLIEKIRALAGIFQHKAGNVSLLKLTLLLIMVLMSLWCPEAVDLDQWRTWLTEIIDALQLLEDILPLLAV